MQFPAIIVNFKAYESAFGAGANRLAQLHEEVSKEQNVSFGICVSALDIRQIAASVSIPVFAQHVDLVNYGAFTGFLPAKAVKAAGAFGTLLNHAEHKLSDEIFEATLKQCREAGLYVIACAESVERAVRLQKFGPDVIALEPPELIGGDISVSTARPELISDAVSALSGSRLLVGAGVKNSADVAKSLELGASGVLLASGVIKAADPKKVLEDLCDGIKK